jgi:hypothetical protein
MGEPDVTFDRERGQVRVAGAAGGAGVRVLVPAAALAELSGDATAEARGAFATTLGRSLAAHVRTALLRDGAPETRAASLERVVGLLADEAALAGLGAVGAERWGRALVLSVDHSPFEEAGDGLLAAVLGAALTELAARPTELVVLDRRGPRVRMLALAPRTATAVRERLDAGESWGAVLVGLHAEGPAS